MAGLTEAAGQALSKIAVTEFPLKEATSDSYSTTTVNLSSSAFSDANYSFPTPKSDPPGFPFTDTLQLPFTLSEIVVGVGAIVGNGLVLLAFMRDRKLRRRTNYYIVSLAIADFLIGLIGIPVSLLASIGLPRGFYPCFFSICFLIALCTASIFCLLAVSVDRYWAILHPMAYTRDVGERTAFVIICICWVAATIIGFLPMLGWYAGYDDQCYFTKIMDYDYLVFLYFATIIAPALLMAFFYADIYRVVLQQLRKRMAMDAGLARAKRNGERVSMRALLGAAQQSEIRVTKNLAIIVLFFVVCWIPLYTVNCITAFCPECPVSAPLVLVFIILSHLNSAVNPIIYAYRMKDFREAFRAIFCSKKEEFPISDDPPAFLRDAKKRRTAQEVVVPLQEPASQSSGLSLPAVADNSDTNSTSLTIEPLTQSPSQRRGTTYLQGSYL